MRLRTVVARWLLGLAVVCWTGGLRAQQIARAGDSEMSEASIFGTTPRPISNLFGGRLRPVLGGVASGGGIGVGMSYDLPSLGRWRTTTAAMVTQHRYSSFQFDTTYQDTRIEMAAYARMRDMPRLNFFGPGSGSHVDDRTTFRLRDPLIGGVAAIRIVPSMSVGGRVEAMWPSVDSGRSPDYPSIEERFSEHAAPGLAAQPRLDRYQLFVDIDVPASVAAEALHQGAHYRVTYSLVDDRELDRFSFRRLDVEGQQRFAGVAPRHRLTLHAWLSTSHLGDGNDVPFFLQPTLGGRGHVWSVHEGLIGMDGTRATLRGFRSFRFRDRNLVLLQAEYRMPVWGPIETSLFVDAGKVADRPRDVNLADLKRDYGFGVRLLRGRATAARMDVGFGSGEGTRFLVSLGDFIP